MQAFQLKSFSVHQDRCALKVGTDAILLGSWASSPAPTTILDIGTGTGIIALMLAQRFPEASFDAVEIDGSSYEQAADNFRNSDWADRLTARFGSVQEFRPSHGYDLIVSNPPYFHGALKPAESSRRTARHTDALSSQDLIEAVDRLLTAEGQFNVVIPADQRHSFMEIAESRRLHCVRLCNVRPTPNHPPKRVLMEFARRPVDSPEESELAIELRRHVYSPEYAALAREFLLKL